MASIRSTSLPFNSRDGGLIVGLVPTAPGRPMSAAAATSATPALRAEPLTTANMQGGKPRPPCASDGADADAPKCRAQDHADIVARELLKDFYRHVAEHGGDRVGDLLNHTADVLHEEFKAVQQDTINEIRPHDE